MTPDPDTLIACPTCDMLHREVDVPPGGRLRCRRCGTVLMTGRANALDRALAGAFGSVILMLAAIFFPFLELSIAGLHRKASLLDAALAFTSGIVIPLSAATALLIIVLPLVRAAALGYTLLPLRLGRPPARGAERAFRLAAHLRPWAMAEVFLIGVVVALVKIGGMASVDLGPAFWAMAALVLLVVYEATGLDEWLIWQTLDRARRS
ncbi:MAG: paraquat-inducible protein A [Amaricoccus sp.]